MASGVLLRWFFRRRHLASRGPAEVESLSCASAGNCAAGGYYTDASRQLQAFVVSESDSAWGRAQEVPGFAALNIGGRAQISSVSCASAGNCAAGGYYTDASRQLQAFVVSESDSAWGRAQEVPRIAALNIGGRAEINSVSCASAGNCAAGGFYTDESHGSQAFVVTETRGIWTSARQVAGPTAPRSVAVISSVSCASAGNCAAGEALDGCQQAFVVSERNGRVAAKQPGCSCSNADGKPMSSRSSGVHRDPSWPRLSVQRLPHGRTRGDLRGVVRGVTICAPAGHDRPASRVRREQPIAGTDAVPGSRR